MAKVIKIGKTQMIRVDRTYPCPICGKTDWCMVFADQTKAVCARNLDSSRPQFGQAGTIYELTPDDSKTEVFEPAWESLPMAKSNVLHKVYTLVIDVLGLTKEHIQHLTSAERGLSVETISLRGYASSTKVTRRNQVTGQTNTIWEDLFVQNGLPKDAWKGVPGFYYHEKAGCPIFESQDGILIPCRNSWGQIVGFQVRLDHIRYEAKVNAAFADSREAKVFRNEDGSFDWMVFQKGTKHDLASGTVTSSHVTFQSGLELTFKPGQKYVFVSSTNKPEGTSAKSLPHFAFADEVLAQASFDETGKAQVHLMSKVANVMVTEGLLKGDIIASVAQNTRLNKLGNILVISMAGVSAWRPIASFIGKQAFKENSPIYLAFDQDFEDNDTVFERMANMIQNLVERQGCTVRVLEWSREKGLDDFLLTATAEDKLTFKSFGMK